MFLHKDALDHTKDGQFHRYCGPKQNIKMQPSWLYITSPLRFWGLDKLSVGWAGIPKLGLNTASASSDQVALFDSSAISEFS